MTIKTSDSSSNSSELSAPRASVAASPSSIRSLGAIWGGSFLMLLPGGLIVTYIGEIITGTTRHGVPSQVGLIAFLAGLVFLGFKLVTGQLKERQAVKELNEEQTLLLRARVKGGVITVAEAAVESRLSILDAKRAFEKLSALGVCHVDVTEQGELCYRFAGFLPNTDLGTTLMAPLEMQFDREDATKEKS
ncbi:MAG: hypothetical protein KA255_17935 [Candidatus Obscuribacter sp.]|nr:hypothetical protein [Candidatus Obscuribacter sp.]